MKAMKSYSIDQIAQIVGGIVSKIEDAQINRIGPPLSADETTLALAMSEEEIENLDKTKAKVALVPLGVGSEFVTTIEVERPKLAMMKLLHLFYVPDECYIGIHPSAIVSSSAKIGNNVAIGANVYIGSKVEIGDNTKIMPNCFIGSKVKVGSDCIFHPCVNIADNCLIGDRVILHHSVSIGADGFSFVTDSPDNIEQARKDGEIKSNEKQKVYKIPSIGAVTIEDDVEIGANSCIDKGTIENTVIGAMTKIDNLVQIGHNCRIGRCCMIVSQVGIAGSCKIGDRTVIAGQSGLADHIEIGSDSIVMASSGVSKSFPSKSIVAGTPAIPRKEFIKQMKALKDISILAKKLKKYEYLIDELEKSEK